MSINCLNNKPVLILFPITETSSRVKMRDFTKRPCRIVFYPNAFIIFRSIESIKKDISNRFLKLMFGVYIYFFHFTPIKEGFLYVKLQYMS